MAKKKQEALKPKQLQLIYDEVAEKNQSKKELQEMYKDALKNVDKYNDLNQKKEEIKNQMKTIELKVQAQLGRAYEKLLDVKSEINSEKVLLTDLAINDLMAGTTVEVEDKFGNKYEPIWSVKFKKVN
jgi:hypothetical protein